jgi:Arc/MetJ-type ribon-helix-helix transcriptional regulator
MHHMGPKPRMSVQFTEPQLDFLRAEADRLGISVADAVRRIVDRYRGEREEREQRDRAQKDKRGHDHGGRP